MEMVTDLLLSLAGIAASGLQVGWPLLVAAFGLAGAACFSEKDRTITAAGLVTAAVGLVLFVWNWKRIAG